MHTTKVGPGDWVVICDGRKWLILDNVGDERSLNLRVREEREIDNPPTHLQGADTSGRASHSAGERRTAVGQTDWHDEGERTLLRGLASRINEAVLKHESAGLILIAPPRALCVLRSELSAAVLKVLRAEIHKDYVALPVHEIEKRIAKN